MKFILNQDTQRLIAPPLIEGYIDETKETLLNHINEIFSQKTTNIPTSELKSLLKLKKLDTIIIKPADKNLGIVILDTTTYVAECLKHLSSSAYQLTTSFPTSLKDNLQNIFISFKTEIHTFSPALYRYLTTFTNRLPRFYGLPNIHKLSDTVTTPPLRPIVSHTDSLLSHSAQLIDHLLQPLAKSYQDYLHNSTELINTLSSFHIDEDVILVSMDIISLYPSIPQECLNIIHKEMKSHQDTLLLDPNLIIQLLAINMHNNYFEFAGIIFKQTTGIAMGAAFSPTVANIFMSVFLRNFFSITNYKPLLLRRYIDDIFIIWPKSQNLNQFTESLNKFHPNIKFTMTSSSTTINFLDLTIYKGPLLATNHLLDIKTYQKEQNLYQYLHFSSNHRRNVFKSIITGECIRYARTNTEEWNYQRQVQLLKQHLTVRAYPLSFINKHISRIKYNDRNIFLHSQQRPHIMFHRPIFKCVPPPRFNQLKEITLRHYNILSKLTKKPIFSTLKPRTLSNILVRAKLELSTTNTNAIVIQCSNNASPLQSTPFYKPKKIAVPQPTKCGKKRCATCQHYNTANYFRSTSTKQRFRTRHPFSCDSKKCYLPDHMQ